MENKRRFNEEDTQAIRTAFGNNTQLLKIVRKVLVPYLDKEAELGMIADASLGLNIADKSPEDAVVEIRTRQQVIATIEQGLLTLEALAKPEESAEERVARAKKNSTA